MLAALAAIFLAASLILETAFRSQIALGQVLAFAGLAFLVAAVLAPYRPRPPEVPVRRARWLAPAVVAVAAIAVILWWPQIRDEWFVIAGNRDEAGGWYGWWSGQAGGLQPVQILVLAAAFWYHRTCHDSPRCLRWGKYEAAGGTFRLCARHHPDLQGERPRRELIHRMHREHQERTAGKPS